jgi:hypothetical protein
VVGSIRGFPSHVKKENPDITTHCFIHREVLVSKTLGDEMEKVLNNATKMVNFIKQRPPLWSSGQSSWLQIQRSRVWNGVHSPS